jgi:RNA polymerase nonessential primary-like sigma factor
MSLNVTVGDDTRETFASMVPDDGAQSAFEAIDDRTQAAQLARAMAALSPEQRQAVALRAEGLTLAEVAARLGTVRERVRKLEREALARLRRALREAA